MFILSLLASLSMVSCSIYSTAESQALETPPAVSPTQITNDNVNRSTSEPYTGELGIFEEPEREKNLQINRVMDILKISEGKTVADIGAGSGWFTVRAAKRVGMQGRVFAVEINQEYINHINDRAKKENLANINTIFGKTDDPLLPKSSVDAVLILKTYHEIAEPLRFMKNLRTGLRSDALVGIIDRNGDGNDHGIKKETVVEEAMRAGFTLKEEFDFVKPDGMDYFLVFQLKK
jgi:cyclopropane fatty-acyl-phospholipid synthase-like methyltransferase